MQNFKLQISPPNYADIWYKMLIYLPQILLTEEVGQLGL